MNFTLMKTATYCCMQFVVAIAVAYALTRNWTAALAIGVVEPFVQTFFFALHDRFWARYDGRDAGKRRPAGHGSDTHGGLEPATLAAVTAYTTPQARG